MKKIKLLSPIIYYIAYFVINSFIAFAVTFINTNPNLSSYNSASNMFFSIIGNLGILALLFVLTCLIFKKTRARCNTLLILTIIFGIWCMFLDVFESMFSMFFDYSQLSSFKNPTQWNFVLEYIHYILRTFSHGSMIIIYIPLLIMIILRFFIDHFYNKKHINFKYKLVTGFSSLLLMIIPIVIMNVNCKNTFHSISMSGVYGSSHVGVYNYYFYSLGDQLFDKDIKKTPTLEEQCDEFLNQYLSQDKNVNYTNMGKGKNLVLIQMEGINDFVINLEVNDTLITPNLTKLANENLYYRNFYSNAGIGNTSDCEFATLTGLYPNGNDLSVFTFEGKHYQTMPKDFSKLGYSTFSIHGNDGKFYNRSVQHVETLGFQKHIDRKELLSINPEIELINNWVSDEALLQESVNIFKQQTTNFFAYEILVTSHSPFLNNEKIAQYNFKGVSSLANNYLDYVHYVDSAIGKFMQTMEENDLLQDTIIMIYADHTSQLLKSDLESILKKDLSNIEYRLQMQNVPLIMINPIFGSGNSQNLKPGRVYSQVDLYPTIANLFGLDNKYKIGADMLNNEITYVYSPRNLDLIFNDYVIEYPSKKIYYFTVENQEYTKLTEAEINKLCEQFEYYKYHNDLLLSIEYFK